MPAIVRNHFEHHVTIVDVASPGHDEVRNASVCRAKAQLVAAILGAKEVRDGARPGRWQLCRRRRSEHDAVDHRFRCSGLGPFAVGLDSVAHAQRAAGLEPCSVIVIDSPHGLGVDRCIHHLRVVQPAERLRLGETCRKGNQQVRAESTDSIACQGEKVARDELREKGEEGESSFTSMRTTPAMGSNEACGNERGMPFLHAGQSF